jgi:predicted kinase
MPQCKLIVLVGPPGSGKSQWAKRNAQGAVVVSQDDLIDAITPQGFDHGFRPVYTAAENAIARKALSLGFTVIVDRTNRTRRHRERWIAIAGEFNCPVFAVVIGADADLCRERNRGRTDHRRLSDVRMERMLAAMEPVAADEGFTGIEHIQTTEEAYEYCNQAR